MKILQVVVFALAVAGSARQAEAVKLYGATASGSPGNLYILNPATGAALQNIGATDDALGTNYPITGLAYHPATGVLYGSTGNNPVATAGLLVTINPLTALVTVVGPFNAGPVDGDKPATMADLAFDSAGNLYGVGSVGGPQLYSIDVSTAQATVIGNTGLGSTTGGGLEIASDGTFYGTPTASRYGTYNPNTGAYTNITNPAKPGGGGAYAALAFNDSGVLYGLNSAPGNPPPTFLVTIDPTTGAVTNIGQSVNAIDAIAFVIPEPSSLVLMVGTVLVALRRSARRRS